MAKGNMLQGMARGKVGDVVFSRLNGQQISRVRNRAPRNPRSVSQMGQRVKLAAPVEFYKRNRNYYVFAFNDKKQHQSWYNVFVAKNVNISPYLTKQEAAAGIVIPAPYNMTSGFELPLATIQSVELTDGKISIATSVATGEVVSTWDDIRQQEKLRIGDMVTLAVWQCKSQPSAEYKRIILQHIFTENDSETAFSWDGVSVDWSAADVTLVLDSTIIDPSMTAVGANIVYSRNDGGVKVGSSKLVLNDAANGLYNSYRTAEKKELASTSYGENQDAVLDPKDAAIEETERIAVEGVSLPSVTPEIEIGETYNVQANISPTNASNKNVTWSSSNTAVAIVSGSGLNARITAVAAGTATITAKTADGGYEASMTVNVPAPVVVTAINATPATATLNIGEEQVITITPTPSNANAVYDLLTTTAGVQLEKVTELPDALQDNKIFYKVEGKKITILNDLVSGTQNDQKIVTLKVKSDNNVESAALSYTCKCDYDEFA